MSLALLERETYSVADAADILGTTSATLHRWLEGSTRGDKVYAPVLRPSPTGSSSLTWGEFVEAGLLCQYRRDLNVKLREIRTFIKELRERQGVPHPLAHYKPWVGEGCRLLLELQTQLDLPDKLCLVAATSGQAVLLPAADSFVRRIDWDSSDDDSEGKVAIAWRPHDERHSPVRCSPTRRFGRPSIKGISTGAISEHLDSGESVSEVAEQFGLEVDDICWACSYELSRKKSRAA